MSKLYDRLHDGVYIYNKGLMTRSALPKFYRMLGAAEVFDIQNVNEYFVSHVLEGAKAWTISDFPNIAPPFPCFWMECRGIWTANEESRRDAVPFAHGVLVEAYEIEPDEETFDIDGSEITVPKGSVKWGMSVYIVYELQKHKPTLLGNVRFLVTPTGEPYMIEGKYLKSTSFGASQMDKSKAADLMNHLTRIVAYPALFAISLLHCNNVNAEVVKPEPKVAKAFSRRNRGRDLVKFKVLKIEPMRKELREAGASVEEKDSLIRALHIRRGHFKHFGMEWKGRMTKPLFGRHTGSYWWNDRLLGSSESGVVVKTYKEEIKA